MDDAGGLRGTAERGFRVWTQKALKHGVARTQGMQMTWAPGRVWMVWLDGVASPVDASGARSIIRSVRSPLLAFYTSLCNVETAAPIYEDVNLH